MKMTLKETIMNTNLFNITAIFQISVFILTMYYIGLSLFGLIRKRNKGLEYKPEKSFALIVAAHNEEIVIGNMIESLKSLDYPKELYDIFVIADNCTDNTASIARKYNVNVYERFDKNKRGKGYALEWMFDKIFKLDKKYDAVGIFDADNLVSENFLNEMNIQMVKGYKVVQGYLDSKNPHDSWITESYSIAFWSSNRLFQLARRNLGLSNQIGGTGFVVDTDILKELGWGATCLTEDLEFTCKLVLNGYKVGWAHDAIVYDEKPLTLKQSWYQRKRWMQGFADVSTRFFLKLLKKAVKDRSFVALDCALYVIQPFVTLALGASLLLTAIQNFSAHGMSIYAINYLMPDYVWKFFSIFQFMLTPFVMVLERKFSKRLFALLALYSMNVFIFPLIFQNGDKLTLIAAGHALYLVLFVLTVFLINGKLSSKIFVWYLLYGLYTLTWIPITIQGILHKNKKVWHHTKHVRQIGISEV
jgi:cellulose synthase/poly-beta-1,6-N-acetylglucosamine synthase-like glycosyltransferase